MFHEFSAKCVMKSSAQEISKTIYWASKIIQLRLINRGTPVYCQGPCCEGEQAGGHAHIGPYMNNYSSHVTPI